MVDTGKNVLIGVFVVVGILLFGYVLSFLHPSIGDGSTIIRARFTDVDKVSLGTRVTYAGRPVGEVVEIILIEQGRSDRTDSSGRAYMYELVLHVDSSVFVYNTDTVAVTTSGLLGERSIGIIPRKPQEGEQVVLLNNQTIYAESSASVEEAIMVLEGIAGKAEVMLDEVINLVRTNNDDLNKTLVTAHTMMEKLSTTLDRANETDVVASVNEAAISFGDSMEELKKQLEELENRDLWTKVTDISENLRSITEAVNKPRKLHETIDNIHLLSERLNVVEGRMQTSLDKVDLVLDDMHVVTLNAQEITESGIVVAEDAKTFMKNLSAGNGTIGKLINEDDLYLQTQSLMGKAETLMNDINHYGLLFHLNKNWKRGRTKRANEIAELDSPKEFRRFFDEEVDQIGTSLGRVNMLLQEADEKGARQRIMENDAFTKVFADLLRQVKSLEQSLQYYNESLQEPR